MTRTRDPLPYELKLVVLIDDMQFHAFLPYARLDAIMDAFETRIREGPSVRHDRMAQMSLRQWIATRLRDRAQAQETFNDVAGAASLWLGLRHYEGGTDLRRGVDLMQDVGCVLTISIGSSPQHAEGTAWSFMVDADIRDGRTQIAEMPSDQVRIYGTGTTRDRDWRGTAFHPKT